jgi:hypothetical protein
VRVTQRCLGVGFSMVLIPVGFLDPASAAADCVQAGYSTICSSTGEVRGGGPTPPSAGPYYPSYCADPWYCDDGWDMDVIWDPGRPGRPGVGPR